MKEPEQVSPLRSPSFACPCESASPPNSLRDHDSLLKVELTADFDEPRRHDLQRIQIRRPVGQLIPLRRACVEQVEDIEVDHCPGVAVPEDLAETQIDGVQAIAV